MFSSSANRLFHEGNGRPAGAVLVAAEHVQLLQVLQALFIPLVSVTSGGLQPARG